MALNVILTLGACSFKSPDKVEEPVSSPISVPVKLAAPIELPVLFCDPGKLSEGKCPRWNIASSPSLIRVVNFWASWCEPCRKEMPDLLKLAESFSDKDLQVILVSVDQDLSAAQKFLKKTASKEQISRVVSLWDETGAVTKSYDVYRFPETVILSKSGKQLSKIAGEQAWAASDVRDWIKRKIAEQSSQKN